MNTLLAASALPATMQTRPAVDLSVIIVNWNAGAYLPAALASLFQAQEKIGDRVSMEVWLVDNASSDDSLAWVRQHHPQVGVIANRENRGYAAANNQGIDKSSGRFLLLLNPDTELPPAALAALIDHLEQHPQVGAVGPRLVGARGKTQGGAAGFDPSPATIFNYATFLYRLFPHRLRGLWLPRAAYLQSQPILVDWVSGACMLVRRQAVQAAGPLDEGYFMYSEDVEWCRRMRRAGFQIVCRPDVSVVHHIGGSARQRGADFYAHNVDSLDRDLRRRYPAWQVALMHLTNAFGFLLRYVIYEFDWLRWRNPAFVDLRDAWAACLKTSWQRIIIPANAPRGRGND
ncbi:MAG: glycosyltransferase family 2 protein [Caldilineales bacterium]|nr:glycosyltransferase family 2 protein [Caldilineales bacterium]MCW5860156.1 glycosyltransferase family 2 protein [Caldilineales bacterium]